MKNAACGVRGSGSGAGGRTRGWGAMSRLMPLFASQERGRRLNRSMRLGSLGSFCKTAFAASPADFWSGGCGCRDCSVEKERTDLTNIILGVPVTGWGGRTRGCGVRGKGSGLRLAEGDRRGDGGGDGEAEMGSLRPRKTEQGRPHDAIPRTFPSGDLPRTTDNQ